MVFEPPSAIRGIGFKKYMDRRKGMETKSTIIRLNKEQLTIESTREDGRTVSITIIDLNPLSHMEDFLITTDKARVLICEEEKHGKS